MRLSRLRVPRRLRALPRPGRPRPLTFRTRLAAAITGLFLLAGVALLAFVVVLARYGTAQQVRGIEVVAPVCDGTAVDEVCDGTAVDGVRDRTAVDGVRDRTAVDGVRDRTAVEEARGGTAVEEARGGADSTSPAVPHASTATTSSAPFRPSVPEDSVALRLTDHTVRVVQDAMLRQLLLWSGVGLALIALLTGFMGRWLAGRVLRPVAAVTDTARRISEQHLHERLALTGPDDELHRLADTFDGMLDRLEKSFESQRRFVANASHELRTPLAVQRTSLEVGLADPLPDGLADVREDLLAINRDAEKLIASLLLLARSDLGLDEDETEESDLADAARQAVGELRARAEEKRLSLTLTAGSPLPVVGDPVLLRHLVTNLVDNAVRYNLPGGSVSVVLTGRTLTVTNTGDPVAPEQVERLFEPFQRLGQDRTSTSGHGLGLSIVASIAQAHTARVTARPRREGGLTVSVAFAET